MQPEETPSHLTNATDGGADAAGSSDKTPMSETSIAENSAEKSSAESTSGDNAAAVGKSSKTGITVLDDEAFAKVEAQIEAKIEDEIAAGAKAEAAAAEEAVENGKRKKFRLPRFLNFNNLAAIMLTLCALTTAWASWIGSLHGSDQDANYAKAERLNTEANASYNLNAQTYIAAFNVWTYVYNENAEIKALEQAGDTQSAAVKKQAMDDYIATNCPDYQNFKEAIYTALEKGGTATPFDEYSQESFFADSEELANQAVKTREDGDWNNLANDSYGLVSLLYSLCLFLFGMVGFYHELAKRRWVFYVGVVVFIAATIYMIYLPLPVNFDFANYFKLLQ
jgi:hypothetical protein